MPLGEKVDKCCKKCQGIFGSALTTVFGERKGLFVFHKTGSGDLTVNVSEAGQLGQQLLDKGVAQTERRHLDVRTADNAFVNRMIICTWPFFAIYLCTQPLVANLANNTWYDYYANYTVYAEDGSIEGEYPRPGMCSIPLKFMHCTDGQNFTELAMKYRPRNPKGCGCGQGVLGEGLCPMTSYGYTLSDFVSTEPGIAAMLGLSFFPLMGTWKNTRYVNLICRPSIFLSRIHMMSMAAFQFSYVLWGIASDCIFPNLHSVLTVCFLGSFLAHWVITAFICIIYTGVKNAESLITFYVATTSVGIITLGAIPRIFLTLNSVFKVTWFPNWNRGIGAYAFWAAEVGGLTLTFGAYPILLLAVYFFPKLADLDGSGEIDGREEALFAMTRKYG